MRPMLAYVLLLVLGAGSVALAQEDLDRVAAERAVDEQVERFMALGLEREAATLIAALSATGMSPAEILLTMMMGDKGRGGDAGGLMLLMNAMKNGGARAPVVIDRGEQLLIVEGGTLYAIDLATMTVTGTLDYVKAATDDDAIWQILVPLMAAGGRPERVDEAGEVCRVQLGVLGGAFQGYVAAHETLPGEQWVAEITPLLGDARDALRCPLRERAVAFAMNDQLVGVAPGGIAEPAETILLFETALDDANPVGGPEALPEEGVHEGGVNVLMADGEARWLPLAEARERLAQPVGR